MLIPRELRTDTLSLLFGFRVYCSLLRLRIKDTFDNSLGLTYHRNWK